ncbi:MAG: pyridoxamine 5'-phosphate oxidase family protein [Candidatus Bathyarchaeota archaeon]
MSLKMDEKTVEDFLLNGRILRMASVNKDGSPHIVPVWYLYENGKFYFTTNVNHVKVKNIKNMNKVAFTIDVGKGYSDLKGVIVHGIAKVTLEPEFFTDKFNKIISKYVGDLNHRVAKELLTMDNCVIEITPYKKISWDFGKIWG